MKDWGVPGLSISIRNQNQNKPKIISKGYGFSRKDTKTTPDTQFRIASLSKSITAVCILQMQARDLISLDDKIFGPEGILWSYPIPYEAENEFNVQEISIEHLLSHTAGGWNNETTDVMFQNKYEDHSELIKRVIFENPLDTEPGSAYAYSNFGYCLLARCIEAKDPEKRKYEQIIKADVLDIMDIKDPEIAFDERDLAFDNEAWYWTTSRRKNKEDWALNSKPCQAMNMQRMDGNGGWIATADDMVQFLSQLPKFLSQESMELMKTPSKAYKNYGLGFSINEFESIWHISINKKPQTLRNKIYSQNTHIDEFAQIQVFKYWFSSRFKSFQVHFVGTGANMGRTKDGYCFCILLFQ